MANVSVNFGSVFSLSEFVQKFICSLDNLSISCRPFLRLLPHARHWTTCFNLIIYNLQQSYEESNIVTSFSKEENKAQRVLIIFQDHITVHNAKMEFKNHTLESHDEHATLPMPVLYLGSKRHICPRNIISCKWIIGTIKSNYKLWRQMSRVFYHYILLLH